MNVYDLAELRRSLAPMLVTYEPANGKNDKDAYRVYGWQFLAAIEARPDRPVPWQLFIHNIITGQYKDCPVASIQEAIEQIQRYAAARRRH